MEVMRVGSSSGLVVAVSSLATTVGIKQRRQAAMDASRTADRSSCLTAGERRRVIFVVC